MVDAHRRDAVRDGGPAAPGLPRDAVDRALHRYGDRVGEVLALVRADPRLGHPLPGAPAYLATEVVHAVVAEGALHVDDVLTRRTALSLTPDRGGEPRRRPPRSWPGRWAGTPRAPPGRPPRLPLRTRGRRADPSGGQRSDCVVRAMPAGAHRPVASPLMWPLTSAVRFYPWGSRTVIPELLGQPSPAAQPHAELWMGAHPDQPSLLADGRPLDRAIAEEPERLLGAPVVGRFGPRLPFLLKVLAADRPLSLQAHPTMEQAAAGYTAEEAAGIPRDDPTRTFKDPWHKPELLL
ncbi:MAG TPA: type I phosphomannose isomerase catalytic subunit, partial [Geodermatophilus sp.]|nr:type I phosphomannose isomerase catalytic subunit [Geodermatophilus sp.]